VKIGLEQFSVLAAIRLLHAAVYRQFSKAAVLSRLVSIKCAILALNRGRCPLTDLAGRYTEERADSFDIYLPLWLARHNKSIFGALFVSGELVVLWQWLGSRGSV
jgi:hypothetical protein